MITTNKTFTVAGFSLLNNVLKVRFANNLQQRIKVLNANAHTQINLVTLTSAQTKLQAANSLLANAHFNTNKAYVACLQAYIAKNTLNVASASTVNASTTKKATTKKATTKKVAQLVL
jgi:serine protease inhibitor